MAMYRFSSSIALLLKSGVPMLETMHTLIGVFHTSPIYREALVPAQAQVASGRPLAASLEETGLFTSMLTNMVRIGEESGQLAVGDGADRALLQGEDGDPGPQGHQDARADHHHGHGHRRSPA